MEPEIWKFKTSRSEIDHHTWHSYFLSKVINKLTTTLAKTCKNLKIEFISKTKHFSSQALSYVLQNQRSRHKIAKTTNWRVACLVELKHYTGNSSSLASTVYVWRIQIKISLQIKTPTTTCFPILSTCLWLVEPEIRKFRIFFFIRSMIKLLSATEKPGRKTRKEKTYRLFLCRRRHPFSGVSRNCLLFCFLLCRTMP